MYEAIQIDEIVDYDLFDLCPIDLCAIFVYKYHILH